LRCEGTLGVGTAETRIFFYPPGTLSHNSKTMTANQCNRPNLPTPEM
jgi:hypothetical protein